MREKYQINSSGYLFSTHLDSERWIDWLIDGCLMPTLAVFQYYRGVHKFYILDTQIDGNHAHGTVRNISAF
jgi:hypothetical protein